MAGRPILDESMLIASGYGSPECVRRRVVLQQTLDAFENARPIDRYHRLAAANLGRWKAAPDARELIVEVKVIAGDWGDVTQRLTKRYGACFAVLNMANADVPGGGYVEGAVAQEENIYRRTDCHFHLGPDEYDEERDRYLPHMTRLLSAADGRVYLDTARPRVCIRGSEDRTRDDLGYRWLDEDEVFPFYEMRAAAQDLRDASIFDAREARKRIAAQLDTLQHYGIRHAVLGAFGCGAFLNPSREVARLYREAIESRKAAFAVIAFAIFSAGYGPGNFTPFDEEFRDGIP